MSRARGSFGRLVRSELRLLFGRRRTLALLAGLALVPLLLALVLFIASNSGMSGQGPGFIDRVTGNGLFLVIAALFMCLPFLLPLTIGITAGDAIAGEAQTGTLRYVLTVPVARTRLLAAKALVALAFAFAAVLVITIVALAAGGAFFGFSEMTLLSGTTVSLAAGVGRMLGVAAYVALSLTGLVAVGLFFSTLTDVPVGAMAATTVVAVVSSVLDTLPQLSAIHPYLLTHHWFDFAEFLRLEVDWSVLASGLLVQLGWVAIFASLAWGRFRTADVTA
ncbi:ABC transporter permease [Tessaracoccus sp. MC1865]|uniref:ABC transporter permease n=1 Tax=Tessaracoccus sp. MC1865 TaxID=2760310 RepID=UPI001600E6BC|nr:ABC transporter permease [Tessaracoccus sp. MC1865]MBB1482772.1 ABC transporter permease [Tessaracoccus sp. MC1865]QTO37782.1 ABC transporter permease [Tessaracoccus sp. MC1865]